MGLQVRSRKLHGVTRGFRSIPGGFKEVPAVFNGFQGVSGAL